ALRARPRFGPALSLLRDVLVAQGQAEAAAQALLTYAAPGDLVLREEAAGLLWRAGMEVAAARLLLSTEEDSQRLRAALGVLLERALTAEGTTARVALIPLLLRMLRERLAAAHGRPEATVLLSRLAALQQHEGGDPVGALQALDVLHTLAPLVMAGAAE